MNEKMNNLKSKSQEDLQNKMILNKINDKILSSFEDDNLDDQKFYSTISKFSKDKVILINEEIENFINGINDYSIFLNNICVILANKYGSFNDISLQIIEYLKTKTKNNDINKLEEIHKKISDSLQ